MERINKKLKENGKEPKYKKIDFDFWFLFWFYILKNQKTITKSNIDRLTPPKFFLMTSEVIWIGFIKFVALLKK